MRELWSFLLLINIQRATKIYTVQVANCKGYLQNLLFFCFTPAAHPVSVCICPTPLPLMLINCFCVFTLTFIAINSNFYLHIFDFTVCTVLYVCNNTNNIIKSAIFLA